MQRIAPIFMYLRPGTLCLPGLLLLILLAGCAAPAAPRAMPSEVAMALLSGAATVQLHIDSAVRQSSSVSLPAMDVRMVLPQISSVRVRLDLTSDDFALGGEWEREFDLRAGSLFGLRLLLAGRELSPADAADERAHERARGFQLALRL